jgi:hypothetical protein
VFYFTYKYHQRSYCYKISQYSPNLNTVDHEEVKIYREPDNGGYQYETGKDVQQICMELKINAATFNNWPKKYSGMDANVCEISKRYNEGIRN